MPKVFHPRKEKFVAASSPHPENTQYKISIGEEIWGDNYIPVLKVQMIYNGEISGRRSPSYPLGTDDYDRVQSTIKELIDDSSELISKLIR